MPTSTAARWTERAPSAGRRRRGRVRARRGAEAGFTLIEIGLVLLIIAVVVALVVPRFRDQSHAELLKETRKLATTFRYLQHEAILNGRVYRLNIDLDQQRYFVTSAEEGDLLEGGFERASGILARDVALPASLQIADVDVPMISGKLYEGVAFTHFYPDGYVDPTVVHLDNGQEVYTLYVPDGLTGRSYVASGYLDLGAGG
jgi:type II secretory pathway pseudopilin PulG